MKSPTLRLGIAGRATTVITPWGQETYQVWIDQSPPGWVARIVTLPNRVWARPGGREAVKFHAATLEEAEGAALAFIDEERVLNGRRLASPRLDAPLGISAPAEMEPPLAYRAPRLFKRFPLLFGRANPDRPGLTANLSETGLFVITDRPGRPGSLIEIDLRLPDAPLLLGGKVVWVSEQRVGGRSLGFGVRLLSRPGEYLSQLRLLGQPGT